MTAATTTAWTSTSLFAGSGGGAIARCQQQQWRPAPSPCHHRVASSAAFFTRRSSSSFAIGLLLMVLLGSRVPHAACHPWGSTNVPGANPLGDRAAAAADMQRQVKSMMDNLRSAAAVGGTRGSSSSHPPVRCTTFQCVVPAVDAIVCMRLLLRRVSVVVGIGSEDWPAAR